LQETLFVTLSVDLLFSNQPNTNTKDTMSCRRPFQFSAPGNESMPELSPKRKPNPEPLTSGDSDFESATGSPAPKLTRNFTDIIEGGPQVETEQTQTKLIELIEGGPQLNFEKHDLLVKSSYFTEPQPDPPYSPIKNLLTTIQRHNQPITLCTTTMAQPVNGTKKLNLNKPKAFNRN
jgi:hypothetical protein